MNFKDTYEYKISNSVLNIKERFTELDIVKDTNLDVNIVKRILNKFVDNGILTKQVNYFELNI